MFDNEPYICTTCKGKSRDQIQRILEDKHEGLSTYLKDIETQLENVKLRSTNLTEEFENKMGPIEKGILSLMKQNNIEWEEYYCRIYTGKLKDIL